MMSYEQIIKRHNFVTEHGVKCKCGHKVFLGGNKKDICRWCGEYVFANKKLEFEYRMKENIIRKRRQEDYDKEKNIQQDDV